MKGRVFHIGRFSVQDGPGIRSVVFLSGCPLRCLWCHNPEGMTSMTKIFYDPQKCIVCFRCAGVCRRGCHKNVDGLHLYDRSDCLSCGECAGVCPSLALSVSGRDMTAEEVLNEVMRDKAFFRRGGGGVTLSGGEPLIQTSFAEEILCGAHERGITTCVETCGYVATDRFRSLLPHIDTLYFDYKATGEDHLRLTGVTQELILHNLAEADRYGSRIALRCPVIPDCNMNENHYRGIAETANRFSSVYEIHLEPYHPLGESKARQMSVIPAYSGRTPEKTLMESVRETILASLTRDVPVIIQ